MRTKIFVTGVGIISAIGNNVEDTLISIRNRKSGIGKLNHIISRHKDHLSVGEVKPSNEELKTLGGITDNKIYTRTALLGIIAAKEALRNAWITDIKKFRTGLISATSVGGMGITENHFKDYLNLEKNGDFLKNINVIDSSDSTERIADNLDIRDYISTVSTACSSSANSIMFGARLIKQGLLDRVIVGGTDSLSRFTINGFLSLKILDNEPCKPFDNDRKGLNLGEGAGFIVLESERAAKGKEIICELSGYGNSNDAYHQTSSSPDGAGAYLAMQKSFQESGLTPGNIDYINAHGTGTELNDLSEGLAIERIFNGNIPAVSSTKAFTGHTLAASGGIEAVLSVLAIKHNTIYPSLNYQNQMAELGFSPVNSIITDKSINHVLSNSFGFGGNTSSLIFSRI